MESVGPRDREIQGLQCTITDVLIIMAVRIHISMIRVKNSSSHISQTFNKNSKGKEIPEKELMNLKEPENNDNWYFPTIYSGFQAHYSI